MTETSSPAPQRPTGMATPPAAEPAREQAADVAPRPGGRPTRTVHPAVRPEARELAAPPALTGDSATMPFQMILPVVGALTSVTMMVVLRNGQPLFLMLAAVIFLVAIVGGLGFALSSRGREVRQRRRQRERYLDFLERTREELQAESVEVAEASRRVHPAPSGLLSFVRDPARRWERRRGDADHLGARIGTASVDWFDLSIPPPESPLEPSDPSLLAEAELLASTHGRIDGMPTVLEMRDAAVIALIGPHQQTLPLARAVIAQLAAHQLPEDVQIAAAFGRHRAAEWAGVDLLPHAQSAQLFDGPVAARRIAPDIDALATVLGPELVDRVQSAATVQRTGRSDAAASRIVVLADQHGSPARPLPTPDPALHARDLGITVIHLLDERLHEPDDVDVRIDLTDGPTITVDAARPTARTSSFQPDSMPAWEFTALARQLAAMRALAVAGESEQDSPTSIDIAQLLGIDPARPTQTEEIWRPRGPSEFLRVPFATDDRGQRVFLDLKESAQQGMGPHGICIGATGSGKSEMLRTLVLALALTHSPEDLSMVLVDYKGGAAFAPFARLPHLAGLIDNLADDPQLTVRARSSLQGEVVRRQQMLKAANSSPSITHYREMRRTRPDLEPMPHLFVVIDEFGELLTAERDFVDLFLQIGRIGRSIGVHLLLSSQRIEGGQLRGLDTYLSYSLALRTFSESESQMILGSTDAFHLPPLPGYGYLKVDTSVYQRFRAGYVSGPVPAAQQAMSSDDEPRVLALPLYNTIASGTDDDQTETAPILHRPRVGRTLVDEMVDRIRDQAEAVDPVWLDPLPPRLALGTLLERVPGASPLQTPIGLQDDPTHQTQGPWILDLSRQGGHAVIIGAPQSGRSTALRTVAASLALRSTPREVAIYGLDLTGSGLRRLEAFPHVGGVATRGEEGRMQRLLEELTAMLRAREALFKARRIDSMAQFRELHARGDIPEATSADVILLVDGYGALRSEFEPLEAIFTPLLMQASSYGIHIVVTMGRWGEMRMAHQSLFGHRIELRQNDPSDSIIDRKLASIIPADTPGRALADSKLLGQIALPLLDDAEAEDVGAALDELARRSAETWSGPAAAPIRLLPSHLDLAEMPDASDEPHAVPLGLRQDTMDPTFWEFLESDQHLVVFGDSKSGKSTLLRTIARGLIDRFTPDEIAIAVVDPRGHVPEAIPEDYLAAHATSPRQAAGLAASIAAELEKRPERSIEEQESSPRVVLMIDDHDIVTAGNVEPFAALLEHLPSARDLKFHVILARPVAGASRALYSPFVLAARETGGATLLMSGDRAEGQILPRIYPERMPPGRGRYVRRGERSFIIQIAQESDRSADATDGAGGQQSPGAPGS